MNIFRTLRKVPFNSNLYVRRYLSVQSEDVERLSKTTWDVVISGGGMVGCALAASLGSSPLLSGKRVLLLETSPKTEYAIDPDRYSNRVCALNKNTKQLFDSFHAWDKICSIRMKEVRKMVVWESCSDARISFQHDGMHDDIAYIVENDVILNSLWSTINGLADKVHVLRGMKATEVSLPSNETDLVTVELQNGVPLKTKLLVGADGVNSLVRNKMKVKYLSWNYDQKGIVATLKLSEPTENVVAWQRFLPTGPIALLPLSDDLCSLVWTVSLPMCEKLLKMPEDQFVDSLNSSLWDEEKKNSVVESAILNLKNLISTLTPGYEPVRQLPPSILSVEPKSRAAFPLGLGHATEYVAPRVALVGDSAHRVHPLAGQGVNLGFGDVKCLTECLEKSVYNGDCIGSLQYLLEYETKRQRHVLPTMFAIDALNRIYKTEFTPFVLMRSLGVTALDACQPMKNIMIGQASV
ncbi:Ubiquinone biosynthesis monooxygenase COQ6, mitochondrial [Araneus ventricosus]|uniref:Ubiquinone biosynthesis monooxygenase COQ6, mitochondrial n=1 Tax=Araneus ventricosus TaxID=182803 RepID=A0A4Y2N849_ARAVE|nr:Ubiquinone biosynthesis monooxygenase COQ6, mitochondrial [Araneus ventricosus]